MYLYETTAVGFSTKDVRLREKSWAEVGIRDEGEQDSFEILSGCSVGGVAGGGW